MKAKIYKVSLFDDRKEGQRTEMGLPLNDGGMVFFTNNWDKALEVFNENVQYLHNNYEHNNRSRGDKFGVSVNIASTWGFNDKGECRWNWEKQSMFDYLIE